MTAKQYYKQTSDMAYLLDDYTIEANKVNARIQLNGDETPEYILSNNDFYALNEYVDGELSLDNPKFEIVFIHDSKHYDVYAVNICDMIDCRVADGGKMVLSCDKYELVETVDNSKDVCTATENNVTVKRSNPFDSIWNSFMRFPDITIPNVDSFFKEWDTKFKTLKDNGGQYCSITCKMDGDGNGYYCKVDKDGVVEKTFKKVGNEIKEVADKPANKELKDLIK